MLPEFLRWLHERYAIDHHYIRNKDDTGFYTRFYIQKSMYIAQHLGLEAGYRYSQHVYGPYSQGLASDCRDYNPGALVGGSLPSGFDRIGDTVLRARSKGLAWMEVATTILEDARERGDEGGRYFRDAIESSVAEQKYQYTDGYVRAVYDDLLNSPLGQGLPTEGSGPATIRARHE